MNSAVLHGFAMRTYIYSHLRVLDNHARLLKSAEFETICWSLIGRRDEENQQGTIQAFSELKFIPPTCYNFVNLTNFN